MAGVKPTMLIMVHFVSQISARILDHSTIAARLFSNKNTKKKRIKPVYFSIEELLFNLKTVFVKYNIAQFMGI